MKVFKLLQLATSTSLKSVAGAKGDRKEGFNAFSVTFGVGGLLNTEKQLNKRRTCQQEVRFGTCIPSLFDMAVDPVDISSHSGVHSRYCSTALFTEGYHADDSPSQGCVWNEHSSSGITLKKSTQFIDFELTFQILNFLSYTNFLGYTFISHDSWIGFCPYF